MGFVFNKTLGLAICIVPLSMLTNFLASIPGTLPVSQTHNEMEWPLFTTVPTPPTCACANTPASLPVEGTTPPDGVGERDCNCKANISTLLLMLVDCSKHVVKILYGVHVNSIKAAQLKAVTQMKLEVIEGVQIDRKV